MKAQLQEEVKKVASLQAKVTEGEVCLFQALNTGIHCYSRYDINLHHRSVIFGDYIILKASFQNFESLLH